MSIVIADTGPLHYLVLIEAIELLPALFGAVLVPEAVRAELDHTETPMVVRRWIAASPPWLSVRPAEESMMRESFGASGLDEGEREALVLATQMQASLILMDDRAGVAFARAAGFSVMGTLGILDLGARRGLVDLAAAIIRLRQTNFRCRPSLIEDLLARYEADGKGPA